MAVKRCEADCLITKERSIVKLRQAERRIRRITEIVAYSGNMSDKEKILYIIKVLEDWI